ncbi:hypothetical protein KC324_g56 [Hortaea werneckii]|nr:hypothetical protein KC324_g56 [Hortaea werneckii]
MLPLRGMIPQTTSWTTCGLHDPYLVAYTMNTCRTCRPMIFAASLHALMYYYLRQRQLQHVIPYRTLFPDIILVGNRRRRVAGA